MGEKPKVTVLHKEVYCPICLDFYGRKAEVITRILAERERQDKKWGTEPLPPVRWLVVLGEEFGEVSRALHDDKPDEYYEEMIHVAAVALSACEDYLEEKEKQHEIDIATFEEYAIDTDG